MHRELARAIHLPLPGQAQCLDAFTQRIEATERHSRNAQSPVTAHAAIEGGITGHGYPAFFHGQFTAGGEGASGRHSHVGISSEGKRQQHDGQEHGAPAGNDSPYHCYYSCFCSYFVRCFSDYLPTPILSRQFNGCQPQHGGSSPRCYRLSLSGK
jgi:hypothetical protein